MTIKEFFSDWLKKEKERKKKERKSLWPNKLIKYTQRFVGLSKYHCIRKMLNKNAER